MNKLFSATTLLAATIASVSAQPVAKKYDIQALPTFCDPARPDDESKCGQSSYAYDINNEGVVVGFSQGPLVVDVDDIDEDEDRTEEIRPFGNRGFRWQAGVLTEMGHLGNGESFAFAISSHGVVAGRSSLVTTVDEDNETVQLRAFISDSNNVMSAINDPVQATRLSSATGIANAGHVVGYAESRVINGDTEYYQRGFIKFPDSVAPVLIPGLEEKSASVLRAVNSTANVAVGYAIKDGAQRAIMVSLDEPSTLVELPDLGGSASSVNAVNDDGIAVGRSQVVGNTSTQGFIYSASESPNVRSIGLLKNEYTFSTANDINNDGLVVGSAVASLQPTAYHAVAYDSSDSAALLVDLNARIDCADSISERWTLVEATAVNDAGQIIGFGAQGTVPKAFILTPLGDDAPAPVACESINQEFENQSGGGAIFLPFLPLLVWLRRRFLPA